LDEVEYDTEPTKEFITNEDGRIDGRTINYQSSDGVLIHGLYLEGAGWHKGDKRLEDSQPKELFYTFPILHVTAKSNIKEDKPGAKAK